MFNMLKTVDKGDVIGHKPQHACSVDLNLQQGVRRWLSLVYIDRKNHDVSIVNGFLHQLLTGGHRLELIGQYARLLTYLD